MSAPVKSSLPAGLPLSLIVLTAVYSLPLYTLARFSVGNSLYSHALLVPFISLYLIYSIRQQIDSTSVQRGLAGSILLGCGAALAGAYLAAISLGLVFQTQDYLAWMMLSFAFCVAGLCGFFLGPEALRSLAFPLGFLGFMAPLPLFLERLITTLLQEGSASVAHALFKLSGTPVFYNPLVFKLPGITLEVAPECSGIHSSLVLLLTSLLAGFFLLRSPTKCALLALATLPLAVFRNGLRIFIIGELCVRVGPEMIDSDIHRRGGPFFYALSLLPLSLLLWWLWRSDRKVEKAAMIEV